MKVEFKHNHLGDILYIMKKDFQFSQVLDKEFESLYLAVNAYYSMHSISFILDVENHNLICNNIRSADKLIFAVGNTEDGNQYPEIYILSDEKYIMIYSGKRGKNHD